MKKKYSIIFLAIITITFILVFFGCKKEAEEPIPTPTTKPAENNTAARYEDGIYISEENGFNNDTGWKYIVKIEVEGGKIASADWNAVNINGGKDKKTVSVDGEYGMVAKGGAQDEWHVQAQKAENYLIKTQDPKAMSYTDNEGHTDTITGVSIHVKEFFTLAQQALETVPVGLGKYKDGTYHAEDEEFSNGWKATVDLTVLNGYIAAANWNAIPEEGDKDKKTTSKDGEYGMVTKGGAQAKWYEQAMKAEEYLIAKQDPTDIQYKDEEGHTDAITGVSINVNSFFTLAEKALETAM